MGVLQTIASWFGASRSLENPRRPLDPWSQSLGDSLDGSLATSGVRVNRDKALTSSGFWRGVNLISGTVAKLPMGVYRKVYPGAELDPRHPAHRLLRRTPNEATTAFVFKRLLQGHLLCHGNAYAYIVRSAGGQPLELLPLDPTRTYPVREERRLWYVHELGTGERRKLDPADMLHLKGLSFDGLEGYSVLSKAREALGLDIGMRGYASTFFRNAARPNVALKHPARLSAEARKNLRESWERMHAGIENAHRVAILEEGMEAQELSVNARDAQLLEARQFSLIEVANILGIPPHKLGAAVNVSYKSLEQENQAYLDDAIDPWLVMWEEECESKLLGLYQRERETHAVSFDRFPLVRADLQQRGAYYVQAISNGWMSPDDVRARESLNPLPGGLGGVYYRPANLLPINGDPDGVEGPAVAPGTTLLAVPDLRQEADYDCGPAAVQAVCQFHGVGPGARPDYAEALGTTRAGGTRPAAILDLLSRLALVTTAKAGLTVTDLSRFFAAGHPVLCPIQAGEPGQESSGHWVVVVGTGLGQVMLHDPAAGLRMLSEEEWLARWHDRDRDGVEYDRYGIAVGEELLELPPIATGEPVEEIDPEPAPTGSAAAREAAGALAVEVVRRMICRLGKAARRAAGRPGGFLAWLDSLEGDHAATLAEMTAPVANVTRAAGMTSQAPADVAAALLGEVREGLLELSGRATAGQLAALVESFCINLETRPESLRAFRALVGDC